MVRADSAARSARLSTMRYSSRAVDLAAAHAHRVDHRHAARGDIVAVAHAAGRLPGDALAKVGPGLLDEIEQALGPASSAWAAGRIRRGPAIVTSCSAATPRPRCRSALRPQPRSSGVAGRKLTRSTAMSGTTLLGPPPSTLAGLTDQAAARSPSLQPQRELGGRDEGVAPLLRIAPGVGRSTAHHEREIAAAAARRPACRRAAPPALGQGRALSRAACASRPADAGEPTSSSLLITTS